VLLLDDDTKSTKCLSETKKSISNASIKTKKSKKKSGSVKPVKVGVIYSRDSCKHASVFEKLVFSLAMTMICLVLFTKPPTVSYPIAEYS